jgi:hypothetical protein
LQIANTNICAIKIFFCHNQLENEITHILGQGRSTAAQKEFSVAQSRIESQLFSDILDGFRQNAAQKVDIFETFFNAAHRPTQLGLATPVLGQYISF